MKGVDISLAGGGSKLPPRPPPARSWSVCARSACSPTVQAARSSSCGRSARPVAAGHPGGDGAAVAARLPAAQIAELLDCHPATVRRWIARFNGEGLAGLADRPRSGRPRLGGRRLTRRIAALLERPGPWTLPRIRRYLGWPQVSVRTLYRRVRLVAIWRRPKLTARGDPYHDHVVAGIVARLIDLPRRAVVLAEDETHLNLLPHVRASWTLRAAARRSSPRARTARSPCSARSR